MDTKSMTKIRIFVASPSDVESERAKVETALALLKPTIDRYNISFEVVDWSSVVPDAGLPQEVIFKQLNPTSWDIFIGILWNRFGAPPGTKDPSGKEYLSGTQQEFETAYKLWHKHGSPRIVIYRCTRAIDSSKLDAKQLSLVHRFFKRVEKVKGKYPLLYQSFDTTESFEKLLLDNLQRLLFEYVEKIRGKPIDPEEKRALEPKIPNNLPRRTAFFGRVEEMNALMRALDPTDRTWGALVDGIGGIGKTTLAIEAAHRAQEAGAFDAFVFVSAKQNILEPTGIRKQKAVARVLNDFLNETARVLGKSEIVKLVGSKKRVALLNALRGTRTLLIYDNLEPLPREEQEAMADFLRGLPSGCKAIITSRRRGGEGAVWLHLGKLDWNAARGIIENEMARDTGLANKLHPLESRWQELYEETKGSPLALVHTLGLMRVRATLTYDGALEMLRGAGRNDDNALVRFVYQEARKELTLSDKSALCALSFFVPSASFDMWAKVANLSRSVLEMSANRLSALSLVDLLPGEERYSLHPLTRSFVRDELLVDANVARMTGMQFAQCWLGYANQYGGYGKYQTYGQLKSEWMNLEATAHWLQKTAKVQGKSIDHQGAARMLNDLASALYDYLWYDGQWNECIELISQAYNAARGLNDWSEAGQRAYELAWIHYNRADLDKSLLWIDRCDKAWIRGGNRFEQATGTKMRALVARQRKDYKNAERLYREALQIYRDFQQYDWISITLADLGELERERRHYATAEKYYRESLQIREQQNIKQLIPTTHGLLGELELDRKRWSKASEWFEKELVGAREVGRQPLIAQAHDGLARAYEGAGRPKLALPSAQEALKIYEQLQSKYLEKTKEMVERLNEKVGGTDVGLSSRRTKRTRTVKSKRSRAVS
jgi:tetratricopeptide (TPR) repeat protein